MLVGDLYQLPPVISTPEFDAFRRKYASPYFFSARVFRSIRMEVIELTKIYRQNDADFIELLNRIRHNCTTSADLERLNQRLNIKFPAEKFCINLTTTNQMADTLNREKLNLLEGRSHISQAVVDGSFSPEYYPVGEQLEFKTGAQIMFLNNDSKNRWVNGSLGFIEVIKTRDDKVKYVSIRLASNARRVEVFPFSWEIYKYSLSGTEIISEVAGSFTQFPFRLAWAVTIHKSQGKTFDNIRLDIGRGTFACGQLYVALSRCTSLEGISLVRPLEMRHIFSDDRIVRFMENCLPPAPGSDSLVNYLQMAANTHQKIEIDYTKSSGDVSRRIVIPLGIRGENLCAFCTQRGEQRSFKLGGIKIIRKINE